MFKKLTASLLVVLICVTLASAVGFAQTKTITMYHAFTSNTLVALRNLINDFQKEYPHIRVRAEYVGDALNQKLQAAVTAGNPPDLAWLHSGEHTEYARTGAIYNLSETFINGPNGLSQEELDDFFPIMKTYMEYNYDGNWWGLPVNATTMAFVYNADMVRAAGYDPDNLQVETWEEFAEFAASLTNAREGIYGMHVPVYTGGLASYFDWFFRPFVWSAGGKFISDDLQTVAFDSPEAKEAVQFFYDLIYTYEGGTLSPPSQAFDMGKVAIHLDGPWSIPQFNNLRFEWRAMLYPIGPSGERFHPSAAEPVVIFKDAKHPEEAWEFLKFWIRPDNLAKWCITSGYLPTRRSVMESEDYQKVVEETPGLATFVQALEYGAAAEITPEYNKIIDEYTAAVELILNQKADLDEAIDAAAAKCNEIIAQYWRDNPQEYEDLMKVLQNAN